MASVIDAKQKVTAVHIDGLAVLKIVKHCQDSLPTMVTGSLLGLMVENGVLEITHAFPFPDQPKDGSGDDDMDGHEYQLEMMKMLREINVDNNCVGWYQSMLTGSYSTSTLVENQQGYQTDLSPNAVVLLYDPQQTLKGNLVLRAYRLSSACMNAMLKQNNSFISPSKFFEEIPIHIKNNGLANALLYDLNANDGGRFKCDYEQLDLEKDSYVEKNLELMCSWVDDLANEQHKFQYYARHQKKDDDAPKRLESLLINHQIRQYCDQMDRFAGSNFGKLFLAKSLRKNDATDETK
eukprot:CAMPEP_0116032668 /NCGR_PEP_ID=MMETSP0321-20121206/18313_1 /TAXON_ID=163516 /ORGANISM="Leptocylindrus danicus var. danicus, Strain B650" /LENGTH=293 /DNA_ID=CAMNT_0003508161 /DNA_START=30 /DNA_END=911 /DNA_ORIENTATION=+